MPEALRDVLRNTYKEKLAKGQVVSTLGIRVFGSIEIAHIAKSCGFDALYIDLQHSSLSLETTSQLSIAALGVGITPLVRVPSSGPEYVSRVLDGGALGVTVPGVRSPADVQKMVANGKFPPIGERSTGGGLPHLHYRTWPPEEMMEVMNETTSLHVTVENLAALDCIEEIAAVRGLDVLNVGTNDLCEELGVPGQYGHELVRKAYTRIIAAARKHGKYVCVGGISDRKMIAEYVGLGARAVNTGSDISMLMTGGAERVKFVRSLSV